MSKTICIMGESGSGKTTAMRTLDPASTYYIDCDGKGLSWRGWRSQYNAENKNYCVTDDKHDVLNRIVGISEKCPNIKTVVIDTINSIMIADERRRSDQKGYDKWVDLAWSVFDIVTKSSRLRDDLTVVCLAHVQIDTDDFTGEKFIRLLTNGKKLNKIGLEKYFTTVLLAKKDEESGYVFVTKDSNSTTKAPMGAFEDDKIPNDMGAVLDALRDY